MDLADVSRFARTLDGVKESTVKGLLRWTLDGRLVARQLDPDSLVVRIGFAERERFLAQHPEAFTVPPRFDAHMKMVARLTDAEPAAIETALRAAWDLQRSLD